MLCLLQRQVGPYGNRGAVTGIRKSLLEQNVEFLDPATEAGSRKIPAGLRGAAYHDRKRAGD